MGSVLSRLFCGCCKYDRESASGSHSNEGNDKFTELNDPAGPPTPASDNPHVETSMDIACSNNGATGACGFDDKWASSQLEQKYRFLSNTTRDGINRHSHNVHQEEHKLIQMTLHDNRKIENIQHVHIKNPKAKAIVIGNDNQVKMATQEVDQIRSKTIEYFERIGGDQLYQRKQNDEILKRLEQIIQMLKTQSLEKDNTNGDFVKDSSTTTERHSDTLPDKDPYMFERSKSNRKSRRKNSFGNDSKTYGLLQNTEWYQYEVIQKMILKDATCGLQRCQSIKEIEVATDTIKTQLEEIIAKKTKKSEKAYLRSSAIKNMSSFGVERTEQLKENAVRRLRENRVKVITEANEQLIKLKDIRTEKLHMSHDESPRTRTNNKSSEETARDAAELFIEIVTSKMISHVSSLLPLQIQQQIIVFTFECQKSFVIKRIMENFLSGNFHDSISYILDPNEFAKSWLFNFTNKKIFLRKCGIHLYGKLAKTEIDKILKEIKKCIDHSKEGSTNIYNWITGFLDLILPLNVLPISREDLNEVQEETDLDIKAFLSIVRSRLDNIRSGVSLHFTNATAETVQWVENPHVKIMESLWGCTHCCPFCHEPCHFADFAHVELGFPHRCSQHRPLGVYGFMECKNSDLVTEWCNDLIETSDRGYRFKDDERLRPCKEYDQEFIDWKIEKHSSSSITEPLYWIWFMCTHKQLLAEVYGAQIPNIPNNWTSVTKKDALRSIESIYICT